MTFRTHLRAVNDYNVRTIRQSPLAELSGSLGDLGTLLPLMIALAIGGSIDLSSTLVFSGLANIVTGMLFGVPLPVQPMKAIAAVAISQGFSEQETAAAGLAVSAAVFVLSASGLLHWLNRVVPVPVVKGIQVGAGLSLVISAGTSMLKPLNWISPAWDNKMLAIIAFVLLVVAALFPKVPYALVVFVAGLVISGFVISSNDRAHDHTATNWNPHVVVPKGSAWRVGAIEAAIPQLPLTTLNSILAVTSLSASLFESFPPPPSTTHLGFSVAISNLIGCWFGAMPICHGSGGLAGQYRFGARSGASIIVLGLLKLLLGLFAGSSVVPLLQRFPKSLLGIMVLAAGIELAKVGQSVSESPDLWEKAQAEYGEAPLPLKVRQTNEQERRDRWMVLLVTVAGCLAFKNDAIGFIAGLVWHWSLRVPQGVTRLMTSSGQIQWRRRRQVDQGQPLLNEPHDNPERYVDS